MSGYRIQTPHLTIAGVDEAGRGPLAGPLVVAAVLLDPGRPFAGLADSKKLSAARRESLFELIVQRSAAYRIEVIEPIEVDQRNILQATLIGMQRALHGLSCSPTFALIDGNRLPVDLPCPAQALVGGDAIEPAISAASILAKVTRDRLMQSLHSRFPQYGFDVHKGYPTALHRQRLASLGPCTAHRMSYAPVRAAALQRSLLDPGAD